VARPGAPAACAAVATAVEGVVGGQVRWRRCSSAARQFWKRKNNAQTGAASVPQVLLHEVVRADSVLTAMHAREVPSARAGETSVPG